LSFAVTPVKILLSAVWPAGDVAWRYIPYLFSEELISVNNESSVDQARSPLLSRLDEPMIVTFVMFEPSALQRKSSAISVSERLIELFA